MFELVHIQLRSGTGPQEGMNSVYLFVPCMNLGGKKCPINHFLLSDETPIVLSVLLRYTDSDYPFGIFKLVFLHKL
jgi:hypothetical protein